MTTEVGGGSLTDDTYRKVAVQELVLVRWTLVSGAPVQAEGRVCSFRAAELLGGFDEPGTKHRDIRRGVPILSSRSGGNTLRSAVIHGWYLGVRWGAECLCSVVQ